MDIEDQEASDAVQLRRVIYLTPTEPKVTPAAIEGIASQISAAAQSSGITGVLLHKEGMFLHVVEGEAAAVEKLMTRMKSDRRQQAIHIASDAVVETRGFTAWALGTTTPNSAPVTDGPVFQISKARILELTEAVDSNLVKSFLTTFVDLNSNPEASVQYC